jgi:hypothetical protein
MRTQNRTNRVEKELTASNHFFIVVPRQFAQQRGVGLQSEQLRKRNELN